MSEPAERSNPVVPKWMLITVVAFFVVYAVTVLATGEPLFLIPVAILAIIVFGYALLNQQIAKRAIARDGSLENVVSDGDDAIPSPALIPGDSETALGDTPEAHDEITPHDLPLAHPGRQAAEEQAGDHDETTTGHADPSAAPPDGARS